MKIFLDTSEINEIRKWKDKVDGFTTNPTLMKKAGVTDYEAFCKEVLKEVEGKPISFEVFADEFDEMERQARIISGWGSNVYVKIPITNTKGESSLTLIEKLNKDGIKINVTALMCPVTISIASNTPRIWSIFAGRIADTGLDPIMTFYKSHAHGNEQLLWASPRAVQDIYQAEKAGADIITITPVILEKYLKMKNYNLKKLSLDTVKMFYNDAKEAGYKI